MLHVLEDRFYKMLSRNLIYYLVDKKTLFHSLNQLGTSKTSSYVVKQPYPLMGFKNSFTNLLKNVSAKEEFLPATADIKQYLQDNACHYKSTFNALMDIFKIDKKSARSIIARYQMMGDIPRKQLFHNYNKLKSAGLRDQLILDNVPLLTEDSNILEKKLESMKKIVENVNDGVCFFNCDIKSLDLYVERSTKRFPFAFKEIHFFQQQLKVDNEQVCQLISKYLNFVTHHPNYTLKKIKLLLDYKVSIHSLIMDDWPMYFQYPKLKTRLEVCSNFGVPIKSSTLNCDNEDFDRLIDLHLSEKNDMQKAEIIQFLSDMSGYNKTIIEERIPQRVFNLITSQRGFIEKVALFLQEGYECHDLIWSYNVLTIPQNKIIERLSILKKEDLRLPNLKIFLCSQKKFLAQVDYNKSLANKSR